LRFFFFFIFVFLFIEVWLQMVSRGATVVDVFSPSADEQKHICEHLLASLVRRPVCLCSSLFKEIIAQVRGWTGAGSVHVTLNTPPPVAVDMRPVDKWRHSIGHHVAHALKARHSPAELHDSVVNITVDGSPAALNVTATLIDQSSAVSTDSELLCMLSSFDAYFYFDPVAPLSAAVTQVVAETAALTVSEASVRAAIAVMAMVRANALLPGVLVLSGAAERTAAMLAALQRVLPEVMAAPVHTSEVAVHGENDTRVVLGTPWDFPRGGLFKFIDEINNPAGNHRRAGQEYAVIVAAVNEAGQFVCRTRDFLVFLFSPSKFRRYVLRELLEGNRSRTHRQMIRKDGVLFILVVAQGSPVTETLLSRAHVVIDAGAAIL
jgi:hypothetical protein